MANVRGRRARVYLNIDAAPVMWAVVILLMLLVGVSFTMSFSALVAVAPWTGLPPELAWAVPLTIDSGILIFTLAALVMRARAQRGGTTYAWVMLLLFTGLSIAANVMHALDTTSGEDLRRVVTGAVLAGAAPFVVATASHMLSLVVIEPADAPPVKERAIVERPAAARPQQADAGPLAGVTSGPRAVPGLGVDEVDARIVAQLRAGAVPTGAQIGEWLGGKSARTGQRYLAGAAERNGDIARLLESATSPEAPGFPAFQAVVTG